MASSLTRDLSITCYGCLPPSLMESLLFVRHDLGFVANPLVIKKQEVRSKTTMEYSFRKTLKDGYLHVRIGGDNDAPTIRRYVEDTLEACAKEKCVNVLIEE